MNSSLGNARVAIVLVNWNGWRECIECIDSVLAQAHREFHVFIVDNDSTDGSIEHLIAWCEAPIPDPQWRRHAGVHRYTDKSECEALSYRLVEQAQLPIAQASDDCKITLIRSGGNLGFAGGCNVGIRVASPAQFSHFWFLNADTVIDRDALVELLARVQGDDNPGIAGSTLLFYDRPGVVFAFAGGYISERDASGRHVGMHAPRSAVPSDPSEVERALTFVCGASMMVSAQYIRDVGPMQEDYFLYYEDADWAMRGFERSRKLAFAAKSIVFHKGGANSSKVMPAFSAGFFYRSRLKFVRRYYPKRLGAAKRRLISEMLRHVARGRWVHARIIALTLLAGYSE